MPPSAAIGLPVSSHVAGTVRGAKFSSVSTTGAVSGRWQVAATPRRPVLPAPNYSVPATSLSHPTSGIDSP
jgi:hypothetical protein